MPLITSPRPTYRHLYGDIYQMAQGLQYRDTETGDVYAVGIGFRWDKGSVIKLMPRAFVPHGDEMTYPSAIHDKHYTDMDVSRRTADRVLRQFLIEEFDRAIAIETDGRATKSYSGRIKAWTAWAAVRANFPAGLRWG